MRLQILKIPTTQEGVTITELLLIISILMILMTATMAIFDITGYKKRARDNRRLADMTTLDRMVNEFFIDNSYYPDITVDDMTLYHAKVPQDPLNEAPYVYSYQTDGAVYEINAVLEYYIEYMANDGGNNTDRYEVGNSMDLLP